LSLMVCQTEGKGSTIKWRTGTPGEEKQITNKHEN
jgi:hypothetical protein